MRSLILTAAAVWCCAVGAVNWDSALIRGRTDRDCALYAPGEEMVFTLTLEGVKGEIPPDTYFIDWQRRGDDGEKKSGRAALPLSTPLVVKTSQSTPGFVCIEANVVDKSGRRVPKKHRWEKRVFFMGGAGVLPGALEAGDEPSDYDAYWASLERQLAGVPITSERREVPSKDTAVKLYAVKIACAGGFPVTGYLTIPRAASVTNRMPITACFRGASGDEMPVPTGGPHDYIRMEINGNGYELGQGDAYIKAFFKSIGHNGFSYGCDPEENKNRDTCYYKGMALRAVRYLQWLMTLPEWNGRDLELGAGSQGGFQAILAAARVPQVTKVSTSVTWGCDWPGCAKFKRLPSTYKPAYFPAMAYFDPCFAARRIRCPVKITSAGLGDYVSPPSGVAVLYNNLRGPKEITWVQGSTHGWWPSGMQRFTLRGPAPGFERHAPADPIAFITDALKKGSKHVALPEGVYTLKPNGEVYLPLKGLSDVTIDFGGSEFRGTVKTRMIDLTDCTNVTIRNLVVDYPLDLPFTQASITDVDAEKGWNVKVIDGYPHGEIKSADDCWPIQVYDRKTLELKNPMRFRKGISVVKTGPDTYRITGGVDRRGEVGDICVFSVKDRSRTTQVGALRNLRGVRCRFENIREYATPHGCAFEDLDGNSNTYSHCSIDRRPPETDPVSRGLRRLRSGNHDAFMNRCAVNGPRLLNCTAKYHCDDCVNISGFYSFIMSADGNRLRLVAGYRGLNIAPGDTCQVMTYDGRSLKDVTVLSVGPEQARTSADFDFINKLGLWPGLARSCRLAYEVTIDRAESFAPGSIIISNQRAGDHFEIRACNFGHSRSRGLLIKASNAVIADNLLEACAAPGMQIATEYEWMEGGCSRDLAVTGNVCRNNGGCGIYIGGSTGSRQPLPADSHRNLVITGNTISGSDTGIAVTGCTGLDLRGNRVSVTSGRPAQAVFLRNCAEVKRDAVTVATPSGIR